MVDNVRPRVSAPSGTAIGAAAVALLAVFSVAGYSRGVQPKLLGIAWVAFTAMGFGIPLGRRAGRGSDPRWLVWGYGLAAGAMITSAAVFLVPGAIDHHAVLGGFGIAFGVVVGYSAHTIGHRLTHADTSFDDTALQLTAHALAAGSIIGIVYGAMPDLGPLLGLAIVSHKGPAGYAAARRMAAVDKPVWVLLLPAAGVGLTAIPAAALGLPAAPVFRAVVFGFAAGVFLHLAMDFLPRCEVGGEVYRMASLEGANHDLLDRLRLHSVASVALGGLAVFLAWLAITP